MTQNKFAVGQEVWIMPGYEHGSLYKSTVSKVGRKYVTVNGLQFHLDTLQEKRDVGAEGYLYLSEQAYADEQELKSNKSEIRSYFDMWANREISLEQTRAILQLLKGGIQ